MDSLVLIEWDRVTIYPTHSQLVTQFKVVKEQILDVVIPFPYTSYDLWFSENKEIGKPIHHLLDENRIQIGVLGDGYITLSVVTDKISAKYHHSLILDSSCTDIVSFNTRSEILFPRETLRIKTICLMYGCSQTTIGTRDVDCFRGDFQTSGMHNMDYIPLSHGFSFQITTPAVFSNKYKIYELNVNTGELRLKFSVTPDQFIPAGECKIYTLLEIDDLNLPRYLSTTQINSTMYDTDLLIDLGIPTKVIVHDLEKNEQESEDGKTVDLSFLVSTILDPPEYDLRVVWEFSGARPKNVTPLDYVFDDQKLIWHNIISNNDEKYTLHAEF